MPASSLAHHFITITDPRQDNRSHKLIDIIMLATCGTLAGCQDWVEIADFGEAKVNWFKTFLSLDNGIPSHDTFGRVFSLLNPAQFQKHFSVWMQSVAIVTKGQVIAIDGKTSRHSFGGNGGAATALHLVSAFATANGVALGQVATDQKSNEITAIPELLKLLDISGCLVTTDAMGCQSDIAADIVARGGDYLLAVKGNQALLHRDIKACFAAHATDPSLRSVIATSTTNNTGHGRSESRVCDILSGSGVIAKIRHKNNWLNLNTIVKVTAQRTTQKTGVASQQTRYYICSLKDPAAERIQAAVRAHWGIENSLHWVLDMAMGEDNSRVRTDHAPANMAVLRHIALNLIRSDKTRKVGIKISQHRAGWSTEYMEKLLGF